MQRKNRSNSEAPAIFPFQTHPFRNQPNNMSEEDAAAAIMVPVEQGKDNMLTGNFNPGNAAGQKIFLDKTKGLPADQRLTLTRENAQNIIAQFKVDQFMGTVVTGIPREYDAAGAVSARMNLIHQCPTTGLEMVQRADFGRFGTDIAPNDPIPDQPWTTAILDPANIDGDKNTFYDQVNTNVVMEIIKNTLTPGALDDLMLQY